ncbi:MAG: RNA polymerase sigma factor [Actinobacteria bacterium]|nr:MAG: RNA polymerase sigma factor [Actinomycetota bacterium]
MEGRPLEERELVLRAQRGDARAYEEIVRTHQQIAFRVAYLVTGNAAEAEDAAQEGFIKAWRAFGRFKPELPVRPWLLQIVANEARNRRRSAGRRAQLALRAERAALPGATAPSPEHAVVDAAERQRLLEALDGLPDDARLVLSCRFLLGLSEEETAATLDVKRGTVKSRTARALDRLKETYERA